MVKPLRELLKEADEFSRVIGLSKTASPAPEVKPDEVLKLAQGLIDADGVDQSGESFEKMAMALNRAEALLQIQTLQKLAQFRTKALEAGYTEDQVKEAVDKIAAKKVHENLATFVAVEGASMPGEDKNSLKKKKVPAHEIGQVSKDLTKSLGYRV